MDATAGITKNDKTPAPPPMPKPGLVLSRDVARLGIGPPRRVPEAWTRPPDDIARGDAAVSARNRLLFSPLALPSLSANGARAGLGPDRTGPDSSGGADVPTRPDAKLSGPVASRVGDDIGEATQLQHARMMGLDRPPDTPRLSANGARAGLGPFVTGSPGDKARADAMAKDLARSISQVRSNARALLGQASSSIAPIRPLSDSSARAALTGAGPIAAAAKGFAMRVPKSPVAQDRERWASGTSARIPGASKGLGLAKADWGDHSTPKPPPKRTWVGVQGDATENPYDTGACSDLALPPHAAVNKSAPVRELQKETVPSDECPPLTSSLGLETLLRDDARLLAKSEDELLRKWASRLPGTTLKGGNFGAVTKGASRPSSSGTKGLTSKSDCGCSDCGCKGKATNGSLPMGYGGATTSGTATIASPPNRTTSPGSGDWEIASLIESFAVRHGKDTNAEWFVPVFRRGGRLVLGSEQRGPGMSEWRPDPSLGMKPGDTLVATVHTHSRSAVFSEDDRNAGAALGVPMILIAPGAERARLYDPSSGSVTDAVLFAKGKSKGWTVRVNTNGNLGVGPRAAGRVTISDPSQGSFRPAVGAARMNFSGAAYDSTALSSPGLQPQGLHPALGAARVPAAATNSTVFSPGLLPPPLINSRLLAGAVQIAAANPTWTAEQVWYALTFEAATWPYPPRTGIPDPDLFRAIVAVAQRMGPGANPGDVLEQAKAEPLWVEPALLNLIINYAQVMPPMQPHDLWTSAWADRVAIGGPLPTPPDPELFGTLVFAARYGGTPQSIQETAHNLLKPRNPNVPVLWPPYAATDLLDWIVFFAVQNRITADENIHSAALFMVRAAGGAYPPQPDPSWVLLRALIHTARNLYMPVEVIGASPSPRSYVTPPGGPTDVLSQARADELAQVLLRGHVGYEVEPALLADIIRVATEFPHMSTDDVWKNALAARAREELLWPPSPRPDAALLGSIVAAARQTTRGSPDLILDIALGALGRATDQQIGTVRQAEGGGGDGGDGAGDGQGPCPEGQTCQGGGDSNLAGQRVKEFLKRALSDFGVGTTDVLYGLCEIFTLGHCGDSSTPTPPKPPPPSTVPPGTEMGTEPTPMTPTNTSPTPAPTSASAPTPPRLPPIVHTPPYLVLKKPPIVKQDTNDCWAAALASWLRVTFQGTQTALFVMQKYFCTACINMDDDSVPEEYVDQVFHDQGFQVSNYDTTKLDAQTLRRLLNQYGQVILVTPFDSSPTGQFGHARIVYSVGINEATHTADPNYLSVMDPLDGSYHNITFDSILYPAAVYYYTGKKVHAACLDTPYGC